MVDGKFSFEELMDKAGPGVAGLLAEAGFGTFEKVGQASDDDLKAIKGIGAGTVKKVRALLTVIAEADEKQTDEAAQDGEPGKEIPDFFPPKNDDGIRIGGIPSDEEQAAVRTGKMPEGYHGPVATKNLLLKWVDPKEGKLSRSVRRGDALIGSKVFPDVPKELIDEMLRRGEAEIK